MRDYLIVLGTAAATVVVATPPSRWLAYALSAVDRPGGRRVHTQTTPRLGGVAIYVGILAAMAVASRLPTFEAVFATTSDPEALLLAATVMVAVGLIDDIRGLSAPAKLAGQLVAAGILVLFGIVLRFVYVPGDIGTVVLSTDLGVLLTIALNAVNLVDGLDGLAAGIVAIAAAALFVYVHLGGAEQRAFGLATSPELVFVALVGACLGFLLFNFHPASVFMGDAGAMLLGLLLGAAGVSAVGGVVVPGGSDFAALSIPVLVPALVLAVPFFDTTWTILRRLRSGRAIFSPDKKHLHHRLIEIGHSHRRAVLIMYYWSALLAFAAVGVGLVPVRLVVAVLGAGVGLAVLVAVVGRGARRWRSRGARNGQKFVLSFTKSGTSDRQTASDQQEHPGDAL